MVHDEPSQCSVSELCWLVEPTAKQRDGIGHDTEESAPSFVWVGRLGMIPHPVPSQPSINGPERYPWSSFVTRPPAKQFVVLVHDTPRKAPLVAPAGIGA